MLFSKNGRKWTVKARTFPELSDSTSVAPQSLAGKHFSAEQAEALCLFGSSLNGGETGAFTLGMVMLGFARATVRAGGRTCLPCRLRAV